VDIAKPPSLPPCRLDGHDGMISTGERGIVTSVFLAAAAVLTAQALLPTHAHTHAGIDGKQRTKHEQEPVLYHLHKATTSQQRLHRIRQGRKQATNVELVCIHAIAYIHRETIVNAIYLEELWAAGIFFVGLI